MPRPVARVESSAWTSYGLDRASFTPLCEQIRRLFLSGIAHGDLRAGDVIPSEVRLVAALRTSRGTVRQALYELRVEGYASDHEQETTGPKPCRGRAIREKGEVFSASRNQQPTSLRRPSRRGRVRLSC